MTQKELYKIIQVIARKRTKLCRKKNKDYATEDALSNFKRLHQLTQVLGVNMSKPFHIAAFLQLLKIDRFMNIANKGVDPENETLLDTVVDDGIYTDFKYILYKERKKRKKRTK